MAQSWAPILQAHIRQYKRQALGYLDYGTEIDGGVKNGDL